MVDGVGSGSGVTPTVSKSVEDEAPKAGQEEVKVDPKATERASRRNPLARGLLRWNRSDRTPDVSRFSQNQGTDAKVLEKLNNIDTPEFKESDSVADKNQKAAETLILLTDLLNTDPTYTRRGRGSFNNGADRKISKGEIESLLNQLNQLSEQGHEVNEDPKAALAYLLNDAAGQECLR